MPFTDGFFLNDGSGNTVFAQHQNHQLMSERGNKVVSECKIIPDTGAASLQVDVETSGEVYVNNVNKSISATTGGSAIDLTADVPGTGGESVFVYVYVNSGGSITKLAGTAAASGSQLPPDVPENVVILAMITLTNGDGTIDTVDIEDWRVMLEANKRVAGNLTVTQDITAQDITSGAYSSSIQTESNNPDSEKASTVEQAWLAETTDDWGAISSVEGSTDQVLFSFPTSSKTWLLAILNLLSVKITINDPSVGIVTISGSTFTVKWYTSVDGGTTWVLRSTVSSLDISDTVINFGTNSVNINAGTITGDLKVRITVVANQTDAIDRIDIDNVQWDASVALKTN